MNFQFLDLILLDEKDLPFFRPIAGSYAVLQCEEKYLLCYNRWRKQWEIPAGKREPDETSKDCAIRELYEETGQQVEGLTLKGLMKVKNVDTSLIKYNPVYVAQIKGLRPFIENDETTRILLWDTIEDIGNMDKVDRELLMHL
ncbi:NUDIX hydrolase [Fictibacillus nanhaiensis]|uniref:NUDIX domain-containing protein n=1 Tax=Fictibacillus nanhaiensis TaxID=742169 RepID=UPI001C967EC7|nr:NUDIX hydrolase [Fictibacillus nanhaiensis]MBY6037679.1 NUDIX hydrolase [Fictibacillus nanhaiensis]